MKNFGKIIRSFGFLLMVCVSIVFLLFTFSRTTITQSPATGAKSAYPPQGMSAVQNAYPNPPQPPLITPNSLPSTAEPLAKVQSTPDSNKKTEKTLSPKEINDLATEVAQKNKISNEKYPIPTPYIFEFSSQKDLPQVYLNAFKKLKQSEEVTSCLQYGKPGEAFFVRSLDDTGDYYLIPFYDNSKVCGKGIVRIKNGKGEDGGWSGSRETIFPLINADEAQSKVEKETGKLAQPTPQLVFANIPNFYVNPFNPYWLVTTTDQNMYLVSFVRGLVEDGSEKTINQIRNLSDLKFSK